MTEAEIEAAAKALCFANGILECREAPACTAETCPHWRSWREEARAALAAAELVRAGKGGG